MISAMKHKKSRNSSEFRDFFIGYLITLRDVRNLNVIKIETVRSLICKCSI